jgi:hypothetical protein
MEWLGFGACVGKILFTHSSHWLDLKTFPDGIYGVKFKTSVLCTTICGHNQQSL